MLLDCHTHTHNSPDADNKSVADLCRRAVEMGLDTLAVTDHCEANRFYSMEYYNAVMLFFKYITGIEDITGLIMFFMKIISKRHKH